jgi:hypothetical protein
MLRKIISPHASILLLILLSVIRVQAQVDPKLNPGEAFRVTKVRVENKSATRSGDTTADVTIEFKRTDSSTGVLHLHNVGCAKTDTTKKKNVGHIVLEDGTVQEVDADYTREFAIHVLQNPENKLFIIDGVETTKEKLKQFDPKKIVTINSYSGDEAVAKYGEKARDGAIVITTK